MHCLRSLLLIFTALSCCSTFAQPNYFQAGVAAFKQGDYADALNYFQAAQAEGKNTPQLHYNLGSTFYKLERYSNSERHFRQLIGNSEWRDLALFNLGLVAEKRDNTTLAQQYFLQAYNETSKDSVRQLASRKINQIYDTEAESDTLFSMSAFYGKDDNAIAFADELQSSSSAVADNYLDLFLFGQTGINIGASADTTLQGFAYQKTYQDLSSLDVSVIGASLQQDLHSSTFTRGVSLVSSQVDGSNAYTQLQFSVSTSVFDNIWNLSYEPSYFSGGSDYEQLDGWQHRLTGYRAWRWDANILRLRIFGELNAREDLEFGTSQYSYSPRRLGASTSWLWHYSSKLSFEIGGQLTQSKYSGNNVFEDLDGVVKDKQRSGRKLQIDAQVRYLLGNDWFVVAKAQHTDNDENFDYYTYQRNQYALGISYNY